MRMAMVLRLAAHSYSPVSRHLFCNHHSQRLVRRVKNS